MKRSRDSRERSPYSRKEARRSERSTYEDDRSSSQYKSTSIHSSSSRDPIREPIRESIKDDYSSSGKRRRDESPEVRRDRKRSHSPSETRRDHDRKDSDRRNDDRKDNDRKDDGRKDRKERDRREKEKRSKDKERNKSREKEDSPMDFDPAVDEEEMMKMMGFASFDSTKVS